MKACIIAVAVLLCVSSVSANAPFSPGPACAKPKCEPVCKDACKDVYQECVKVPKVVEECQEVCETPKPMYEPKKPVYEPKKPSYTVYGRRLNGKDDKHAKVVYEPVHKPVYEPVVVHKPVYAPKVTPVHVAPVCKKTCKNVTVNEEKCEPKPCKTIVQKVKEEKKCELVCKAAPAPAPKPVVVHKPVYTPTPYTPTPYGRKLSEDKKVYVPVHKPVYVPAAPVVHKPVQICEEVCQTIKVPYNETVCNDKCIFKDCSGPAKCTCEKESSEDKKKDSKDKGDWFSGVGDVISGILNPVNAISGLLGGFFG